MSMPYVDTHVHLDAVYDRLKKPLSMEFRELREGFPPGFEGCVCVFSESFDRTMRFLNSGDPTIYGALGMHPHSASQYTPEFEAELCAYLEHGQVRALGEIGLDYHYTLSPKDVQKQVFERQCGLAVERGLPVVIHTREAEQDTMDIMKRSLPAGQCMHVHCYTGTREFAEAVLREWPAAYFGFTGVITFKNSVELQRVCASIPIDRMLSETDGPYMAPIPFRGKPAHCGHIPYIIREIGRLHGLSEEDTFLRLRENARNVYRF